MSQVLALRANGSTSAAGWSYSQPAPLIGERLNEAVTDGACGVEWSPTVFSASGVRRDGRTVTRVVTAWSMVDHDAHTMETASALSSKRPVVGR